MKKISLTMALAIMLFCFASGAYALQYTGSLSTPTGITGTASWTNNVSLSWVVDDTTNSGFWTYTYTWSAEAKSISHIIIELSPDVKSISVSGVNVGDFGIE